MAEVIDRDRVAELVAHGAQLVEVLPSKQFAEDHLPGAVSLPLPEISPDSASSLDPDRPLIVYCWDAA